ncbi:MAG: hypothetical protein OEU50_02890 [Gammaproteobacteria bacterium]|nr:hypothetical protein [Gammaproteobacteria bacterium]
MKTLGSHPGAINFRLSAMVVLILLFIYVFLHYTDKAEQAIELQSVEQTRRVIDSALFIVFATYATQGRLDDLAALEGANPFEFLKEYLAHTIPYRGEIDRFETAGEESGWYYLAGRGDLIYVPFHLPEPQVFRVRLNYGDGNGNGRFDSATDQFRSLKLDKK